MDHIGDSFIRKSIQRTVGQLGLQFISVARYDVSRDVFWVAIASRADMLGGKDTLEELVFTGVGPLTFTQCYPTYRTQERMPEEGSNA